VAESRKKEQKCRFNLNCNQLQLANSLPDPITRVLVPISPLRSTFAKVIVKIKVAQFFWTHSVID